MQEPIVAEYNYSLKPKVFVLLMVIVLSMAALLARLTWLQIIEGNYYKNKAIENSTRVTFLRAPRGNIYDCHGNLLATNKQSISMIAIPAQLTDIPNLARLLSKILDSPYPKVYQTLLKAQASGSVLPVVIERDLDVALCRAFTKKNCFCQVSISCLIFRVAIPMVRLQPMSWAIAARSPSLS